MAPAPAKDKLVTHESVDACMVTGAGFERSLGFVMLDSEALARITIWKPAARCNLLGQMQPHWRRVRKALPALKSGQFDGHLGVGVTMRDRDRALFALRARHLVDNRGLTSRLIP